MNEPHEVFGSVPMDAFEAKRVINMLSRAAEPGMQGQLNRLAVVYELVQASADAQTVCRRLQQIDAEPMENR